MSDYLNGPDREKMWKAPEKDEKPYKGFEMDQKQASNDFDVAAEHLREADRGNINPAETELELYRQEFLKGSDPFKDVE